MGLPSHRAASGVLKTNGTPEPACLAYAKGGAPCRVFRGCPEGVDHKDHLPGREVVNSFVAEGWGVGGAGAVVTVTEPIQHGTPGVQQGTPGVQQGTPGGWRWLEHGKAVPQGITLKRGC